MTRNRPEFQKEPSPCTPSEHALRESEARYRAIVEDQSELICRYRCDGTLTFVNDAYCRYFQRPREELLGSDFFALLTPEDLVHMRAKLASLDRARPAAVSEHRVAMPDDTVRWHQWTDRAIFDADGTVVEYQAAGRDITDFRAAMVTIQQSEQFLQNVFDAIQDGICVLDTDLKIVRVNRALAQAYPHVTDFSGKFCYNVYHGRSIQCDICPSRRALDTGDLQMDVVPYDGPEGRRGWQELYAFPIRSQSGAVTGVVEYVRDVTDRMRAEEERRASEERYRVLFNSGTDMLFVHEIGPDGMPGKYIEVNEIACARLGYSRDELLNMTPLDLNPPELRSSLPIRQRVQALVRDGRVGFEATAQTRNGECLSVDVNSIQFVLDGKPAVLSITRDVTQKKKTDEMLANAQKLESLGILAGGIAHDFNNLLTGIFGHLDLARAFAPSGTQLADILADASRTLNRTRALTQQLLTFSKGGAPVRAPAAIAQLLRSTTGFVLSGSNVTCEYDLPSDLWTCEVDENQIAQAVDNILINARQAMPDGGTIRLRACNIALPAPADPAPLAGRFVRISMSDTGEGITRENLVKIFDPFFTTKASGSGLGLATAFSIVKKHGGHIRVESAPGEGSTFHVYLPAAGIPQPEPVRETHKVRTGEGRILLMDDEEFVRKTTTRLLEAMGFTVHGVANGKDAIEAFDASLQAPERFMLAILDLTIAGGMGGKATLAEMLKRDPGVRAVAASGYSDDPVIAEPRRFGFRAALRKPFTVDELMDVIEKVLQ